MSNRLSPRRVLQAGTRSAAVPFSASLLAQAAGRPTAADIMGPFYHVQRPLDEGADLTRMEGHPGRAEGRVFEILGRIVNIQGEPVANATVELWQANAHGRYAHISDPNTAAPLDPAFQGFGKQTTNAAGEFRFMTIVPGAYPMDDDSGRWTRARHIHFDIRGTHDRLVTQVYFHDDPLNATDKLYQALSPADRETVTLTLQPAQGPGAAPEQAEWLVVLTSG